VFAVLTHVNTTGDSRRFKALIPYKGGILDVSRYVASAIGARHNERYGTVVMGGGGMNMAFAMVYGLSRALFPDGFDCPRLKDKEAYCPANDHVNGDHDTKRHEDGGYALIHSSL
jgi:hypothetical protein